MQLTIVTEERFDVDRDGRVWSAAQGSYGFWTRYLAVFDTVRVVARLRKVDRRGEEFRARADGPGVTFAAVPYYLGPMQYLRRFREVRRALRRAVTTDDAILARVPAQVASAGMAELMRQGRPYAVEVVGDPWDVFAPGAVRHPLRPLFRRSYTRAMQRQVREAALVSYVTQSSLQQRYPAGEGTPTTHYSSVELGPEAYVDAPRTEPTQGPIELVTVVSFAHMYKGVDVLLRAMRRSLDAGLDLRLQVVGDGRLRADHETLAASLDLQDRVTFRGQLASSAAVRIVFDRADLFVLPSRTEGLPRAMIEAMARAVPCIGTRVGGIPELLEEEALVPPEDEVALADRIMALATDPDWRLRASARNLAVAREYAWDILQARRVAFYTQLEEVTERWRATGAE